MNLSGYQKMDPNLLVGLLNTALRNDCSSLSDLIATHDLDDEILSQKMGDAGYHYVGEINQFRHKVSD